MFTFRQSCRICCQNRLQLHSVSCLTISVKYTLLEASQTQPHIIICRLPKRKQQRPKFLIAFTFRQSCRICYQSRLYSYIIIPCMLCLTISLSIRGLRQIRLEHIHTAVFASTRTCSSSILGTRLQALKYRINKVE